MPLESDQVLAKKDVIFTTQQLKGQHYFTVPVFLLVGETHFLDSSSQAGWTVEVFRGAPKNTSQ